MNAYSKMGRCTRLFLGVFIFLAFSSTSQNQDDSFVKFKIKNAGLTVDGSFEIFYSEIAYDKNNPSKSQFNGTIHVSSIKTGIALRDKDLKKQEYFDAAKYPVISFVSTKVQEQSQNKLRVDGNLTIKSITKKVVIEVMVTEGTTTSFTGSVKLNRRDYGVGGNSWILADELIVDLKIVK